MNWCTSCKVVLANEEVIQGKCERCGSDVIRKVKSQWMLKITEYAERLLKDLDDVDYIDRVKAQQKNWIGRSTGAEVDFATTAEEKLTVYTTRPDTLFGATYMVISPEHPYIELWADRIKNIEEIRNYRAEANKKSDFERTELAKDKTGVRIDGINAINPLNGKEIPIYVSDYVLMSYGTGAIMAVPAHDTRDWDFAKAFNLPIIEVVAGGDVQNEAFTDVETGKLVNSGFLNGLEVKEAKKAVIEYLEAKKIGRRKVNYKLRDWVFSRQRYWGEPIPIVHCEKCGAVPVPESELPLLLPEVESYEPTDNGESPIAKMTDWVNTTCPVCGGKAQRETDTMPQWAGSSWYFLRYLDPHNDKELASKEALDYWLPVDWYNGGMEHTTLHLLYSRFWHKFLYDIGVVPTKEPYQKRTSHGMILGENGEKMSKSRGNVINPDDIVKEYGADTMRLYEMFIGDFEKAAPWSSAGIKGCSRFIDRVYGLLDIVKKTSDGKLEKSFHKTIKKVTSDIESLKFNTAIAALMALLNEIYDNSVISEEELQIFITLLNPFAPHLTEEMWEKAGFEGQLNQAKWPTYDEAKTVDSEAEMVLQINGKIKDKIVVSVDASKEELEKAALENEIVKELTAGKTIVKIIVVPKKLVNIVVK